MLPIATTAPLRHPPLATWGLIALNVAAFILQTLIYTAGGEAALKAFLHTWGLVPARYFVPGWAEAHGLSSANWLPFLTNTFLHGGLVHIFFNMWTLYIFGPAVEERIGSLNYVLFYLACGIGASLAHALVNPTSTIPAIGASGAIAGISGAYIRLFPRSLVVIMVPILFFPFFFELPAITFAAIWLFIQVTQGITALFLPPNVGGVAWWAHIGGFVVGWLAATPWLKKPRHRPLQPDEGRFACCTDGSRNRQRIG